MARLEVEFLGAFGSKIYTPLAGGIFAIPNFIAETGIDGRILWGNYRGDDCFSYSFYWNSDIL